MKLSKREGILLTITFCLVVTVAYYYFVFEKLQDKIEAINLEIETSNRLYDAQEELVREAATKDIEIEELKSVIFPIAEKYYGTTDQETFIAEIDKINKLSGMNITKIVFSEDMNVSLREPEIDETETSEPENSDAGGENITQNDIDTENAVDDSESDENTDNAAINKFELIEIEEGSAEYSEGNIKLMQTEIEFLASYSQMLKWLKSVDNNSKNIISGKLEMERKNLEISQNDVNPRLRGKVKLSFYQVKDVDKYAKPVVTFLTSNPIKKTRYNNPFRSYSWAWKVEEISVNPTVPTPDYSNIGNNNIGTGTSTPVNYPIPGIPTQGTTGTPANTPKMMHQDLYGFEDEGIKLKKSTEEITASAEIEKEIISNGKQAAKVNYYFFGSDASHKLYIDLTDKNLTISKKIELIKFKVYAEKEAQNEVGLLISDSRGKNYQIVMANEISWTGWKELKYDFKGITDFPVQVKGVYIAFGEKRATREGSLIFDDINISYIE